VLWLVTDDVYPWLVVILLKMVIYKFAAEDHVKPLYNGLDAQK